MIFYLKKIKYTISSWNDTNLNLNNYYKNEDEWKTSKNTKYIINGYVYVERI